MKKLIPLLILVGGAVSGFSQGTISFRNSDSFGTTDPSGGNRLVYDVGSPVNSTTGVPLIGTGYVAELYAGTSAGSLAPVTASISRFRGSTTASKGKWAVTTLAGTPNNPTILPGTVPGQNLFLQVKVWDFDANGGAGAGSTFENKSSGFFGQSSLYTYTVPNPNDPPGFFFMENLQGFALVPEPSAIALGVIGVAGLLLIRRRK